MNSDINIVEEPAPRGTKFRYQSESRSGPIIGMNSTSTKKTYPSIEIPNYTGRARVVIYCVTKDEPYRLHPHALVGENCADGIYQRIVEIDRERPIVCFCDLVIEFTKKREIAKQLNERKHRLRIIIGANQSDAIDCYRHDLQTIRLCFQVFLQPDPQNLNYEYPLKSKVSQPITNKTTANALKIIHLSHRSSPVTGGEEIMIFCSRVSEKDIQIRLFEESDDKTEIWQDWGKLQMVHCKVGILFTTPKYTLENIDSSRSVFIELVRPSDNQRGERFPFTYVRDVTLNSAAPLPDSAATGHNQVHHGAVDNDWQYQPIPQPNQESENKSDDCMVKDIPENLFDKIPEIEQQQLHAPSQQQEILEKEYQIYQSLQIQLQQQQQLQEQQAQAQLAGTHQESENKSDDSMIKNVPEDILDQIREMEQQSVQMLSLSDRNDPGNEQCYPQLQQQPQEQQLSTHQEGENPLNKMLPGIKNIPKNDDQHDLFAQFENFLKEQCEPQPQQLSPYRESESQSVEMQSS